MPDIVPSFSDLNKMTRNSRKTKRAAARKYDFEELEGLVKKIVAKDTLTKNEEATFNKLTQAAAVLQKYPTTEAYKIIARSLNCSIPNAYIWGQKSLDFFGRIDLMTAKAHRFIIIERLMKMLDSADLDQQIRIMKLYIDVSGANKIEENEQRVKKRVRVVRTTDPKVLEAIEVEEYAD
jgi:hypothetical protein